MRRFLKVVLGIVVVVVLLVIGLGLANPLPSLDGRSVSQALPASTETSLGKVLLPEVHSRPGLSGVIPLIDGPDAFAARVLMARSAEESLDLRYYIWDADTTGSILMDEIRAAAARGVRVRMLIDDNGTNGIDDVLAGLNSLPNLEIRLFNPATLRHPKLASYLFDFSRLNRRMHNKSMTVDGLTTIVGGRNIGDIYFTEHEDRSYFDLDVVAVGAVVSEVSADFDRYWVSDSAYPLERIIDAPDDGLRALEDAIAVARSALEGSVFAEAIRTSTLVNDAAAGSAPFEWTGAMLVSDDPAKGLGEAEDEDLVVGQLGQLLSHPQSAVDLVSAYFIPSPGGTELLTGFAEGGVATRILTNSFESHDVIPVHSGYIKYREALVDAGITVLELRRRPDIERPPGLAALLGNSLSSLHAKTFAVDGERIFIGSFNFDPRSARLNTEMGLLIESPSMAQQLSSVLDTRNAFYEVRRASDGKLEWLQTEADGSEVVHDIEPNTTVVQRALLKIVGFLPLEWMF